MKPDVPLQPSSPIWFPLGSRRRRFTSQLDANVPPEALTVTTSSVEPMKVKVAGTLGLEMVAVTVAPFGLIVPEFAEAAPGTASTATPSATNAVTAKHIRRGSVRRAPIERDLNLLRTLLRGIVVGTVGPPPFSDALKRSGSGCPDARRDGLCRFGAAEDHVRPRRGVPDTPHPFAEPPGGSRRNV